MSLAPRARLAGSLVALALGVTALCAGSASAAAQTPIGGDLFVATTAGGSIASTSHAGVFDLTLSDPSKTVTAFTEHPARQASTGTLTQLVKGWSKQGFTKDPPNAALVVDGAPASRDVMIVALSHPRITKSGALKVTATRITKPADATLAKFTGRADRTISDRFGKASLFVDAGATETLASSITATIPSGQLAQLSFDQNITVDYSAANAVNQFFTDGKSAFLLPQNGVGAVNSSPAVVHTTMKVAIDADGVPALTGNAQVPAGGTIAVSLNGGAPVTIANGRFSIPLP